MKKQIRALIKEKLSLFNKEELDKKSNLVTKNLVRFLSDHFQIHNNFKIGLYAPLADEVDCIGIFEELEAVSLFPDYTENKMCFRESLYSELNESEKFGVKIFTPDESKKICLPDVLLIPGRAFGRNGERVGRGKGHYDKFLENYNSIKIGICFDEQVLAGIPMDEHDTFMDFVVTETSVIKVLK